MYQTHTNIPDTNNPSNAPALSQKLSKHFLKLVLHEDETEQHGAEFYQTYNNDSAHTITLFCNLYQEIFDISSLPLSYIVRTHP